MTTSTTHTTTMSTTLMEINTAYVQALDRNSLGIERKSGAHASLIITGWDQTHNRVMLDAYITEFQLNRLIKRLKIVRKLNKRYSVNLKRARIFNKK